MATIFVSFFVLAAITWAVVGIVKGAAAGGWHTTYRPRALKAAMWLTIAFGIAAIAFGISTWGFNVSYPWWVILGGWLLVAALVALAVVLILGLSTVVKILAWAIPVLAVATFAFIALSGFGVLTVRAASESPAAAQPPADAPATDALTTDQVQKMITDNNNTLLSQIKDLIPTAAPAEPPAADPADPTPGATSQVNGAQPGNDSLMTVCSFTTADAKSAIGVDVQRIGTEACGFVWRAVPKAVEEANCPDNMVCTLHLEDDRKVVVKGDGTTVYEIVAGTFRIWSAYSLDDAVRDVCRLLKKEQAFGAAEVPSFTVEAGNFTCP